MDQSSAAIFTTKPSNSSVIFIWQERRLCEVEVGKLSSIYASSSEGSRNSGPSKTCTWQVAHNAMPPQFAWIGYSFAFNTSIKLKPISVGAVMGVLSPEGSI